MILSLLLFFGFYTHNSGRYSEFYNVNKCQAQVNLILS